MSSPSGPRGALVEPFYAQRGRELCGFGRTVGHLLADPAGRLIWASDALPGATHDLTAARAHGIPAALAADDIKCWADKAYQGAGPAIRVPIRGRNLRGWRRRHNRDHTKIRSLGERAMAILKSWRLLRKLRCSTTRITAVVGAVVGAVVALELAS